MITRTSKSYTCFSTASAQRFTQGSPGQPNGLRPKYPQIPGLGLWGFPPFFPGVNMGPEICARLKPGRFPPNGYPAVASPGRWGVSIQGRDQVRSKSRLRDMGCRNCPWVWKLKASESNTFATWIGLPCWDVKSCRRPHQMWLVLHSRAACPLNIGKFAAACILASPSPTPGSTLTPSRMAPIGSSRRLVGG